jgi:hypothetical protein
MSVSAGIGVNTQQAESSIAKVLNGLKQLREEQARLGKGAHIFAPDEFKSVLRALTDITAAAGGFHRVNLQGLTGLSRESQQFIAQLQRNLTQYTANLGHIGAKAAQARVQSWAQQGGNPLAPPFGQLFPNASGATLQAQQRFYWQQILRGTGFAVPGPPPSGPISPTTPTPPGPTPPTPRDNSILEGMLKSGLIGRMVTLAVGGGVAATVMRGVQYTQERNEARDIFMRQTRDVGAPLALLTQEIEKTAVAIGQSGNEAIKTAGIWAKAAYQSDVWRASLGYAHAAGFARSYGLDINATANTMGGLARYGIGGSTDTEQNKFALKIGQAIRDSGMTQDPGQVLEDLLQQVTQHGQSTFATMGPGEQDAYLRLRMATYGQPALQGAAGMGLINTMGGAISKEGDLAKEVYYAKALALEGGVSDYYAQRFARKSGLFFNLQEVGGKAGTTVLDADWQSFKKTYGHLPEYQQYTAFGYLHDLSEPQAKATLQLMRGLDAKGKTAGRFSGDLSRYGVDIATLNPSGINELTKAMNAPPEAVAGLARKYLEGVPFLEGSQKKPLTDALAGGDPETIRKAMVQMVAKYGIEKTAGQEQREVEAQYAKTLGDALGDKINPLMLALKEVTETGLRTANDNLTLVVDEIQQLINLADPAGNGRTTVPQRAGDMAGQAWDWAKNPWNVIQGPATLPFAAGKAIWPIVKRVLGAGLQFVVPSAGAAELPTGGAATTVPPTGGGDSPYHAMIRATEAKYGIPSGVLYRMAKTESRFNPNAISPKGAKGMMQFMDPTAKQYGVDPFDPASAIDGAGHYLRDLYQQFGSWDKAIAAYNAGPARVAKGIFPAETRAYVSKVMGAAGGAGPMGAPGGGRLHFTNPAQDALDPAFRAALERSGLDLRITSGRQGRPTTPGSMHPRGLAVDVSMAGMDTEARANLVRTLRAAGVLRFGTYSNHPDMLHVDNSTAQGGNWYMHNTTAKLMGGAPEWFRRVAQEPADHGELTININQRANGRTVSRTQHRLRAGRGVNRPRHHGVVDLVSHEAPP